MGIGERIKFARKRAGLSQAELARLVGRSQSAVAEWEVGASEPRRNIVETIARALNVSALWLEAGGAAEAVQNFEAPPADEKSELRTEHLSRAAQGEVFASGPGVEGDQTVIFGEIVEYRPKPLKWANVKGLYGFYAVCDALEPRIRSGELVWVHPHRRPVAGQEAVFVRRADHGRNVDIFVRVYVGQTNSKWIVRQYNPKREIDLKKSEWDCQLIVDIDLNR